jgi:hypothetical protein
MKLAISDLLFSFCDSEIRRHMLWEEDIPHILHSNVLSPRHVLGCSLQCCHILFAVHSGSPYLECVPFKAHCIFSIKYQNNEIAEIEFDVRCSANNWRSRRIRDVRKKIAQFLTEIGVLMLTDCQQMKVSGMQHSCQFQINEIWTCSLKVYITISWS